MMALLRDYHAAIGEIVIKYGTLERYAGAPSRLEPLHRNMASVGARHWLRHRHSARLCHPRHHRLRGAFRLCRNRNGIQCRLSALRRGQAGPNSD